MQGVSVIICSYNSGSKIIKTLEFLALQEYVSGVEYEVIVVDNKCTDDTVSLVKNTWALLKSPFPLQIVDERLAGLSHARKKGIETASYEYVVLCDDDNWLCKDYLKKIYCLLNGKPEVGMAGGKGEAVSDIEFPGWFRQLKGFGYAVGDEGRTTGYVDSVYGAGMALRKSVFLSVIKQQPVFLLSDRKGKSLSSGGDTEFSILIQRAGYKIFFDSNLQFKHFLSINRLNWKYYLELRRSFGQAAAYLQLYHWKQLPPHSLAKLSRIKQILSLASYTLRGIKYLLCPARHQNNECATFIQQMGMRITLLKDYKAIKTIGGNFSSKPFNDLTENR
jgi:glycosyltransferase involved in cell wall biosynthesis